MTTQLISARDGLITEEMKIVATDEGLSPEEIREKVACGQIVIPFNKKRKFRAVGIGKGLSTKINANIGTSPSRHCLKTELNKLKVAVEAGAHAVMDLSTGGELSDILLNIIELSPVMVGTVPIYKVVSKYIDEGKEAVSFTKEDLFNEIRFHAKSGVDFITVHCGITRHTVEVLKHCDRKMGIVSRGGSFLAEWILKNNRENPLYEYFDELLEICAEYDVTLSLGDGLRPGAICDAEDRAQVSELITLGELTKRARARGVQVMIEGPGHVPLNKIAADMKQQKRFCDNAPYYVLGPLPTDIAPGYDHIVGAIGGAVAAANGADFLCYVTPAEHLTLPDENDVYQGIMASRIAAHIGDIEKGVKGAWDRNLAMADARRTFDWGKIFELALDPELARKRRNASEDKDNDVCTMCGELCALKTWERAQK